MAKIKKYITQDDGNTTVVIEGVNLGDKETLFLDNGLEVQCDVVIEDLYKISSEQRKRYLQCAVTLNCTGASQSNH